MKYNLRPETIIDIIQTVPDDRVDTLMKELAAMIHQAKLTYDVARALDPSATARIKPLEWNDDGNGEVAVTHHINDQRFMVTKERV